MVQICVIHSSNKHIKKAAKTIIEHFENIISQIGSTISNSRVELTKSIIAKIHRIAQGYHSLGNLKTAILFLIKFIFVSHN